MKKIGIVDIGSNSIKLDIFLIKEDGSIIKKNKYRSATSLEGKYSKGNISEDNIAKTLKTVKNFIDICRFTGVEHIAAVATQSLRKAKNKNEIIHRIKYICGIDVNVISGQEEANYNYIGVKDDITLRKGIMMDIGGGSTEILCFNSEEAIKSVSLPFGARTIIKEYQLKDNISETLEEELRAHLVKEHFNKILWINGKKDCTLVGSGGTMKNVAKLINHNISPCLKKDNNYHFTAEYVEDIYKLIINKPIEDIRKLKGMSDRRVEVIKGGIEILLSFLIYTNIHFIIVSKKGIREGVLKEYLEMVKF